MKNLYMSYPNFIPELKYAPEEYIAIHHNGWKKKLVAKYWHEIRFDYENGLIYTLYKTDNRKSYSFYLNMGYAASNYNKYLKTGKDEYLKCFMKIVDWLCESFSDYGEFGGWLSEHFIYGCNNPYLSSLTQGRGISLMIRALSVEEKEIYGIMAKKTLNSFNISCEEGGILKKDGNDYWYMEYPCNMFKSIVLNGFITSLTGPYDYYNYFGDAFAKKLFMRGVDTVKKNIHKFELDLPFLKWTRYDDKKLFFATGHYHRMHIEQLEWLYKITDEKIFEEYKDKWYMYFNKYKGMAYWFEVHYMVYKKVGEKVWEERNSMGE